MIKGQNEVRDAYRHDAVARSYIDGRFREPLGALLHRRQVDVLKQVISALRPSASLEIAPGPARVSSEVAPLLGRGLVLADASVQMLQEARRRLREIDPRTSVGFVHADAFNLPFHRPFDLVFSFRLIRHFEAADRARLLSQITRLLRPGGMLVFDAVNEVVSRSLRAKDPDTHLHYDALTRPPEIRAEMAQVGLEVVDLIGVQHRFGLLYNLQVLLAPRSRSLAARAMNMVDRWGGGEPLEWVVVCRRA